MQGEGTRMEVSTGVKEPRRRVWFHTRSSFDQKLVAATELRDCLCSQIWSGRLGEATTEHHGIAMEISRFGEWLGLRTAQTYRSYGRARQRGTETAG